MHGIMESMNFPKISSVARPQAWVKSCFPSIWRGRAVAVLSGAACLGFVVVVLLKLASRRPSVTKRELGKEGCIKALNLNPKDDLALCQLQLILKSDEEVVLKDGTVITKSSSKSQIAEDPRSQLVLDQKTLQMLVLFIEDASDEQEAGRLKGYLEQLKGMVAQDTDLKDVLQEIAENINLCNKDGPSSADFYNLGVDLANIKGLSVRLKNGVVLTSKECYNQAIQLDPKNADAYNNLGYALKKDETVKLQDGRVLTKLACYLEAHDLDPVDLVYIKNLAEFYQPGDMVRLKNGINTTIKDLVQRALPSQ